MYRVLLADDESIFLEFMHRIIRWEDYKCEVSAEFGNGKAACDFILKEKPDIAFIDISMPLMDGIEVCRQVKEAGLKTKLVIITAHDEFNFAYQAIKLGIDDYLLKPFSREELDKTLKKVIRDLRVPEDRQGPVMEQQSGLVTMEEGATKYEIMTHAIDEYLQKNYMQKALTLSVIASDLGFESSYLRRVYKTTTGKTISQRLEEIRLGQAEYLLKTGKYQNQEISDMVGFSDQFYFSRRFKQVMGMSPTEYKSATLYL